MTKVPGLPKPYLRSDNNSCRPSHVRHGLVCLFVNRVVFSWSRLAGHKSAPTFILSVDSSSLLVTWPNHRSLFLLITCTMASILLCLYRSSFLFLLHLVTPCIILITFMSAVVICCSSLFVKVQHSLPKIRIGYKMVW